MLFPDTFYADMAALLDAVKTLHRPAVDATELVVAPIEAALSA